ncbi:MAG: CvpA family protein [Chlorobi bacterium]|nr:CvpA family protein [Chlorobiota bacterium]MCI0715848.1 CvpA family protein [Chlorobiota bacterium]
MNWLDIAIAVMVTLPTYFGYRKGFLRKLLPIAGIIAGFILAVKFYDTVSDLLSKFIHESPAVVNVISFLLIIGILYGTSIWLARFMANINSGTTIVDKVLGFIFGFAQGLLVSSVLLYNLNFAEFPSQKTRETSLLYSNVITIAPAVFDKVIEYFPGLQKLYQDYKNSPKEQAASLKQ